jgi:hypothetical protein
VTGKIEPVFYAAILSGVVTLVSGHEETRFPGYRHTEKHKSPSFSG